VNQIDVVDRLLLVWISLCICVAFNFTCIIFNKQILFVWTGDRCRKLLESGKYDAIYVHGLGAAVDRAVNIALQLKVTSAGCVAPLEVSANTSTIDLIDDFIPVDDEHEPKTRSRRSSAIHIKVFRVGASFVSDSSVTAPQAVSAVAEDNGKSSADARTSEQFESQQQCAVSKSQKQSKKKQPFTKTQSS